MVAPTLAVPLVADSAASRSHMADAQEPAVPVLPASVEDARRILAAHPSVIGDVRVVVAGGGAAILEADFDTDLPSTWKAEGRSPTGVKSIEAVQFRFGADYPRSAPRPSLRPDFNATLPHINPHRAGERVPPCLVMGGLLDVLHSEGFPKVVDQMSEWLKNAAMDTLIQDATGWEPIRRDREVTTSLQLDAEKLFRGRPGNGGLQLYDVRAFWRNQRERFLTVDEPRARKAPVFPRNKLLECSQNVRSLDALRSAEVPLAICWPQGGLDKQPIYTSYQPDTVENLGDLKARAAELGVGPALDKLLKDVHGAFRAAPPRTVLPLFVILAVRRPMHVIGFPTDVDVEFLAYVVVMRDGTLPPDMPVAPAVLFSPLSKNLLRTTSGFPTQKERFQTTFVGCGSFGSKIALHLTRAGFRPELLVDDAGILAAHNGARHALVPTPGAMLFSKTEELADLIHQFRLGRPETFEGRIETLQLARYRNQFDADNLVVNTTASPAVRSYLGQANFGARVVEACAMELGKKAVMTVEGENRSPSTQDLMAYAYELMRRKNSLPEPTVGRESVLGIGVGCNSITLPMSDATVSLITAGTGQFLLNACSSGLGPEGQVKIATVGEDDMSISWSSHTLGKTVLAEMAHSEPGWTVRVLDCAHRKILADFARYPRTETGGIIVGRISATSREVVITDVLDAPADSQRSASRFVLGTRGRTAMVERYEQSAKNVLWCLGTWHSHLATQGPSPTDLDTAEQLKGRMRGAAVLLIRHPAGYFAVVRTDQPA